MRFLPILLVVSALAVAVGPACSSPRSEADQEALDEQPVYPPNSLKPQVERDPVVAALAEEPALNPAYVSESRKRLRQLQDQLVDLLALSLDQVQRVRTQLETAIAELEIPERLVTADAVLKNWHEVEWKAHKVAVEQIYAEAVARLVAIQARSTRLAIQRAQEMAPIRSPLDDGPTGDRLLDNEITSFSENLRASVRIEELEGLSQRDAMGRIELVQVYSSFATEGVDESLGGRLMLFVGGDHNANAPRCQLVLKAHEGIDPSSRRFVQAVRYRIMRGTTVVRDLGWQKMPVGPELSVHQTALFVGNMAPSLQTDVPAFDQLKDMRIVADVQSVLLDGAGEEILGGLDWRIEFRVSRRGVVTWQLPVAPEFNPVCAEALGAFGSRS